MRWTGTHDFEEGDYTFTTTDDGVRLWVDGELIIDQWHGQSATAHSATRAMTAEEHEVKMEHYEGYFDAVAKLSWQKALGTGG